MFGPAYWLIVIIGILIWSFVIAPTLALSAVGILVTSFVVGAVLAVIGMAVSSALE